MGRTRSSALVFAVAYLAMVVGLFLALGGAAYAQSPSSASDQYGDSSTQVKDVEVSPTTVPPTAGGDTPATQIKGVEVSATAGGETAATQAEALPNTGLSLLGVAVLGGALVAGGLMLRRREQRKS